MLRSLAVRILGPLLLLGTLQASAIATASPVHRPAVQDMAAPVVHARSHHAVRKPTAHTRRHSTKLTHRHQRSVRTAQRSVAPRATAPVPAPATLPAQSARRRRLEGMRYFDWPTDWASTPAVRYSQMSRAACEDELRRRTIPFVRQSARGVLAPVRLRGPVQGIWFRGEGTDEQRAASIHEIIDCRLILALDDSTQTLREHDIVEVRHFSIYRLPPDSWKPGQPLDHHPTGVAIDMGRFIKRDGTVLDVDRDFHGAIDAKTCGDGATPRPATPPALELRQLLCALVARRLFNLVLTPNYDRPHKNHFHLELRPGKQWFLVH